MNELNELFLEGITGRNEKRISLRAAIGVTYRFNDYVALHRYLIEHGFPDRRTAQIGPKPKTKKERSHGDELYYL